MHVRLAFAAALLSAAGATPAQDAVQSLPAVRARAVLHVADCGHRALPTQAQVGAWTGQHNFSQVYATRERLMGDLARACHRRGVERVQVVLQAPAAGGSPARPLVALATPAH